MMNGYNFDIASTTLTISESFARKASKVGSPEYEMILKLRRDFPNLTIQKEAKKEGKHSITYAQMEAFIGQHRNGKEMLKTFERIKKLSRVQPMPYRYVKSWFEAHYSYYSEDPVLDAENYVINPDEASDIHTLEQAPVKDEHPTDAIPVEPNVA